MFEISGADPGFWNWGCGGGGGSVLQRGSGSILIHFEKSSMISQLLQKVPMKMKSLHLKRGGV